MQRNVYDFDKTIYAGDSSVHFYLYCARRFPRILLDVPGMGISWIRYFLGRAEKTQCKQRVYRFLTFLPDVDAAVEDFWRTHAHNIKPWYLRRRQDTDIVISASPEFLLAPICARLGIALIASRVDRHTGVYDGLNCHDEEKVRRMREAYPGTEVAEFYSDSYSDMPLFALAARAYLVRGEKITPLPARKAAR